ncbi:MAG: sulfur oxidation c-type cytochrome SoxX [Burkholderiaceae bacterium]
MKRLNRSTIATAAVLAVAIGAGSVVGGAIAAGPTDAEVAKLMKESFQAKGLATLDRLDQTESQAACSKYATTPMPPEIKARLEKAAMDEIRYPADGNYLGDFRNGERIAQSGVGLQFSDNEKTVNGGNCYACHEITKNELAHGNIGPSLYNYGKLRGTDETILKYTWGRLWNSHAFNACNQMPRYGDAKILTDDQLRDVMALLLDPKSPANQ